MSDHERAVWAIQATGPASNRLIGFCEAFKFGGASVDLERIATQMPKGAALCSARVFAGREHARRVLVQAAEYWSRDLQLARNRSIDLLMRITCQSQIARAVQLSGIDDTNTVVLFGIVRSLDERKRARLLLKRAFKCKEDDSSVALTDSKRDYLKNLHGLPQSCSDNQLVDLLCEKAVLLALAN